MLDTKTCWTRENGYSTLVMHLDHAFKGELCDVNNISPLCLRLSLRTTLTWAVGITIDFVLRAFTHHSLKRCQLGKRDNELIHVWRGYFEIELLQPLKVICQRERALGSRPRLGPARREVRALFRLLPSVFCQHAPIVKLERSACGYATGTSR